MPSAPATPDRFLPLPALAAAIFPGLGHIVLGEPRRGLVIAAGVLGLFFGGLFIGGLDAVDSREDRIWFIGQALNGPIAFAADYVHQHHFKGFARDPRTGNTVLRSAYPGEHIEWRPGPLAGSPMQPFITDGGSPPNTKSLGRANELGTLFITVGGMLNLIVIIDAALNRPRRERDADAHAGLAPGARPA